MPRRSARRSTYVSIGLVTAAALAGGLAWASMHLAGDEIATVDASSGTGDQRVDLAARDRLRFTVDVTVRYRGDPETGPRGCVMDLELLEGDYPVASSRCDLFAGEAEPSSTESRHVVAGREVDGQPVECALVAPRGGTFTVRATTTLAACVDEAPRAIVHVLREPAAE